MDSLTQIVLGASVGEAVIGRKVGNKALLYGAIAGTIPDLDVFSRHLVDTVTAIEWHRGFSHSIFFAMLSAPIFGWLVSKIERNSPASWSDWSRLFFWGLFTHPLLDAFTTWGTQLFWPFDVRLAFQAIFVIDPLYTLPFLGCLIVVMTKDRSDPKRRRYNRLGLILGSSYLGIALLLKTIAFQRFQRGLERQHIDYVTLNTRPTPFNTLLWTANIDVGDAYLIGDYSFFDSRPIHFKSFPKDHRLLGDLADHQKVERLKAIAEGWYTISSREQDIYFNDLRFGLMSMDPDEDRFAFSYRLVPKADTIDVQEVGRSGVDAKRLLSALWRRIQGN